MGIRIDNAIVLFGLFAIAIPVVLHLLQRRRFDTLDWGAMQFLPDSVAAQRRRWLDEILLMLVRMGMIALIVLALATPISTSPATALPSSSRSNRRSFGWRISPAIATRFEPSSTPCRRRAATRIWR